MARTLIYPTGPEIVQRRSVRDGEMCVFLLIAVTTVEKWVDLNSRSFCSPVKSDNAEDPVESIATCAMAQLEAEDVDGLGISDFKV